jgi:hypothetical protein
MADKSKVFLARAVTRKWFYAFYCGALDPEKKQSHGVVFYEIFIYLSKNINIDEIRRLMPCLPQRGGGPGCNTSQVRLESLLLLGSGPRSAGNCAWVRDLPWWSEVAAHLAHALQPNGRVAKAKQPRARRQRPGGVSSAAAF